MKLLIILLFTSSFAFGQKDSTQVKDSITTVKILTEILKFSEDKNIGVKDFNFLNKVLTAYLIEKRKQWAIKKDK